MRGLRREEAVKPALAFVAVYLAIEAFYPAADQLSAHGARTMIRGYQVSLSHVLGGHCRYTPTCSEYGRLCYEKYGTFVGTWKTLTRVLRCAPWGPPPGAWPP